MERSLSLEELSKSLFGRTHRLAIWQVLLGFSTERPPEPFYGQSVRDGLSPEQASSLHRELVALEELEMIRPVLDIESHTGKGPNYYVRTDSAAWDLAAAVMELALVQVDEVETNYDVTE